MHKKIVRTYKGDILPPRTEWYEDDSRNPFEIVTSECADIDSIHVFIDTPTGWLKVASIYFD